jgi:hypothetical protein
MPAPRLIALKIVDLDIASAVLFDTAGAEKWATDASGRRPR